METKTIDWNELSEQTKLVLPKNVKIYHSIENGCSILMFEPEKKETFVVGEIVKSKSTGKIYEYVGIFGESQSISKTTIEEKDAFLLSKNLMIGENGEVVRWKPKMSELYFVPNAIEYNLYSRLGWRNDETDNRCFNSGIVFSTKELAIEAHDKMLNSLK